VKNKVDNINFKSRMFDEALKIVVKEHIQKEIYEYNDITENDRHTFTSEFETKMFNILKRGKIFKEDFKKISLKIIQKISVIILIILSISFLSLLSVEAVRTEIYNIIINFYENFIQINSINPDNQNSISGFIPQTIEETYLPSYIPEGYREDNILKSNIDIKAVYINDKGENIIYYQKLLSVAISIDGEDYIETDIYINGINGKSYEYNKTDDISYYIIIWNDNKYFYQLRSYLNKEETIKIAENVKFAKY